MPTITAGDFRNGVTFEKDGSVCTVVEFQHVKPGKGAAFVRTKYKNVMTGAIREESFNPTAKFEQAFVERKEAEYSARITEKPDGHCSIRCTIKALDQELFCLDIGTPDRLSADLVKKQFILKGNEIYQMLITKLTE